MKPEIKKTTDNVNRPSHYQGRHGLESIEVIRNFAEDLKKARKNLDWLIESMEEGGSRGSK